MVVYNIVTAICCALMFLCVVTVVYNLFKRNRQDRITYIRSFKKGKGIVIYLVALPLYFIGSFYSNGNVFQSVFAAITTTIETVVLKLKTDSLSTLMQDSEFYRATVYLCFTLITINAVFFVFSLIDQYVWNSINRLKFRYSSKDRLVIFGNNVHNHQIYKSDTNCQKVVVDKFSSDQQSELYMKNINYMQIADISRYVDASVKKCLDGSRDWKFIVNTEDDERNIQIAETFVKCISSLTEQQRSSVFKFMKIYLFGNADFESVYRDVTERSFGCVVYVNKYHRIAIDFVDRYPFARFMDETQLDYSKFAVRPDVNINAVFIGFGKTNRQIFLTSVANNQFVQVDDGVKVKQVQYHIFDKHHLLSNKNLNHNYYRYKNESANFDAKDYLPLPDYPADEHFYKFDINEEGFYRQVRSVVTHGDKDANFIVIAFGSDLENIDMAKKMVAKCTEWGVRNIKIFVKVRSDKNAAFVDCDDNCMVFGNEQQTVYNIDNIASNRFYRMAIMRNWIYDMEYCIKTTNKLLDDAQMSQIVDNSVRNWYAKKSQLERDSSLYCCLSIRSKLNLMGLDCRPKDDVGVALTEKEYLEIYAHDDLPQLYDMSVMGKPIVKYSLPYKTSTRQTMAIHEHLRWNAYMISCGFIPANRQQILCEKKGDSFTNGKNYKLRRHGNLTTMDGLVEFRKMVARDNVSEEKTDVIKYDYQLMDDLYWLVEKIGYKIVKKDSCK